MDKICLDSDFLVEFLRENEQAIRFIEEAEGRSVLATTYVNLFELYHGAFKSMKPELHLPAVEALKDKLTILNLSDDSVKLAGEIRAKLATKGETVDIRDLFIGTIALANGFSIKTSNLKHFTKIPALKVI